MVEHTFPQTGDVDDAENFAAWLGRGRLSNYVELGLTLSDVSSGDFNLSSGKVHLYTDSAIQASNNGNPEDRYGTSFYVYVDSRTSVAYDDSTTNYVYIDANISVNDSPAVVVKQTDSNPSDLSIKIAEIDSSDNVTEFNRSLNISEKITAENSGTSIVEDLKNINFSSNLNLTDNGNGEIEVNAVDDNSVGVEDNGTTVVSDATSINFSSNVSVTDDGDNTTTVDATDTDTDTNNYHAMIITGKTSEKGVPSTSARLYNVRESAYSSGTFECVLESDGTNNITAKLVNNSGTDICTVSTSNNGIIRVSTSTINISALSEEPISLEVSDDLTSTTYIHSATLTLE